MAFFSGLRKLSPDDVRDGHDEGRHGDVAEEGHPVQLVEQLEVWFALQDEASVGVKDEEGPEDDTVEEGVSVDVDDEVSAGDKKTTQGSSELRVILEKADPQEDEDTYWKQQTWVRACIDHFTG